MTGPATGAPERGTSTRDAASAILVVLALGLAFRLIIAQQLPGSGFKVDLEAFRFWAGDLARNGPFGFYDRPFFHDYTPGYLYVLWLVGLVGQLLEPVGRVVALPSILSDDLIKLPSILADLGLAWLVWSMVQELGGSRRAALIGAAIVVVNPITWFDSVVWGQVDAVGTIFLLLGVRELWRDRPERSAIFTVIAAITKPQLGILVPIVAAVVIRRALFPAGGFGHEQEPGSDGGPSGGRRTLDAERRIRGPIRILTTGLAGLLTAVALSAPFGLTPDRLIGQVATAAGGYPYITVNAYNPWALLELNGNGLAANGSWVCDAVTTSTTGGDQICQPAYMFGPLPALLVGTALLLVALVAISLLVARRPDRRTILVGVAVLALAFFVLPTRVHERYLFPFYAIGAILAAVSIRWRLAYVLLALATFANMYVVLTTLYPDNPSVEDWLGMGAAIRSTPGVAIVAIVHLLGFLWAAAQLRDGALNRLGDEVAATAGSARRPLDVAAAPSMGGVPVGLARASRADLALDAPRAPPPVRASRSVAAAVAPTTSAGWAASRTASPGKPGPVAVFPAWSSRPSFAEVGAWQWLRGRVLERPVRADRSAGLAHESGGRIDRLDVWVLVVLVVAALTLRMWRLAEPYRMHFDEVYHARTATEFLQDWRYGLSHDIYEWTHPHLAKYAMAVGIVAFGDDRVGATSQLGVTVRDAVIEPRWGDTAAPATRSGDRLHVVTGADVRSYDLQTRALESVVAVPGARSIALDATNHRLFVGTDGGEILTVDLTALDGARGGGSGAARPEATHLAQLDGAVDRLHATSDGTGLLAATAGGAVVMVDPEGGTELGRTQLAGVAAMADAGTAPALIGRPADIPDQAAAAGTLAQLLGGSAADYQARLAAGSDRVILATVQASGDLRTPIDDAITDGRLAGFAVETVPRVAVADSDGLAFVSPATGGVLQSMKLDGAAAGVALVSVDSPMLYVTNSSPGGPEVTTVTVGGDNAKGDAVKGSSFRLPGSGSWVGYDEASQMVHVLGAPPAGRSSDQQATVYVIEPHANAVYADAPLGFQPSAVVLDANDLYPSSDREQLLALGGDGSTASVDVGHHDFAWRVPGVVAGALMAGLLYLLTRILFRRRSVALLVGILSLADGMLFVQSRIAMNDAYVGLFIVAAYVLFAVIWTNRWRWRGAFWVTMPAIGLLLGLALASKWVAAYAIGALGILILARSALGRLALIAGMIVVTTVLGYLALSVPAGQSGGNLVFMLIMIALTLVAVVVSVLHPIAWSLDEVRFAVGAPAAGGVIVGLGALALGKMNAAAKVGPLSVTPLLVAFGLVLLSGVVFTSLWLAGRAGLGPLARPPAPDDPVRLLDPPAPAAEGWLRPGWAFGLSIAWTVVSLLAIPLAVYIVSYLPWANIENHRILDNWPPGHTGQTLVELTAEMYRYHNTLTAAHAASSPWWAWPFDLKPVWFYQQSFAGDTAASIYDAGNLVIWWLGIPAMAFSAWQAFHRRSLALALVTIAFACQWIAWARIDRAAFQYHYYTSLPFVIMALAYLLAELWHGASRRTWLLARLAAAAAILGPAAMWLFHRPLCGFVRVTAVNPDSQACPTVIPEFVLTGRTLALAVVLGLALIMLLRQLARLEPPDASDRGLVARDLLPLAAIAGGATIALFLASSFVPDIPILDVTNIAVEPVAILAAVPLGALAVVVATARDARRFVVGTVTAVVAEFLIFYPNISALPLPSAVVNAYQGLLPTYVYPFQFPVSTVDRSVQGPSLFALEPAVLLAALVATALIVAYSAWAWRIAIAERAAEPAEGDVGTALAGGGGGG